MGRKKKIKEEEVHIAYENRTPREQRIIDLCSRLSSSLLCDIEDIHPGGGAVVKDLEYELREYLREGKNYLEIVDDARQTIGLMLRERRYISLSEWWYKERAPFRPLPLRQAAHRDFVNRMSADWRNHAFHYGKEVSPFAKKENEYNTKALQRSYGEELYEIHRD